ncbi:MAG TPA: FAD-dependent oxidoreductase [Acidimicrobiales bacterium]|nr:FAD-dependent oxidoreductase [Acidimicrobiales bacterium]
MTNATRLSNIVVVGASLAGARAAAALRREGYQGRLTMVGAEPHPPYQRPPLSKQFLGGAWDRARVDLSWDGDLEADLRLGTRATGVDLDRRRLFLERQNSEEELAFDGLVVATGAEPRPLPGPQPAGLHLLRTIDDCVAIKEALAEAHRVVVVGAGFIGSEVAATCRTMGHDVAVVEPLATPLAGVLGEEMGEVVADLHRAHGTRLHLGRMVRRVAGARRVEGVRLDDDTTLPSELVVVGLGVRPAVDWLEGSGVTLDDGVVCDETCAAVGVPDVVAAGDVARWHHPRYGSVRLEHWDNAIPQAEHAARTLLLGPEEAGAFDPLPFFWSDQYEVKFQFLGLPRPDDEVAVVEGDAAEGRFAAAYGRDGRTVGALLANRMHRLPFWRRAVADGVPFPPTPG